MSELIERCKSDLVMREKWLSDFPHIWPSHMGSRVGYEYETERLRDFITALAALEADNAALRDEVARLKAQVPVAWRQKRRHLEGYDLYPTDPRIVHDNGIPAEPLYLLSAQPDKEKRT